DLVGDAGLDEDEVAGLVLDRLGESLAVLVAHAAGEDVEHDLEVDVDVRQRDAAGRDGGDVQRQLGRVHVLRRQTGLVADVVPAAHRAAAASDADARAALDRALQVVLLAHALASLPAARAALSARARTTSRMLFC